MFDEHHNLYSSIKSYKLLPPLCIEAVDKNPVNIQIRVKYLRTNVKIKMAAPSRDSISETCKILCCVLNYNHGK